MVKIATTQLPMNPPATNQIAHFKELSVASGATTFKANSEGVFAGAGSYGSAPFKLSYGGVLSATGASISGTITATGGSITGNLTVSGSITAGGSVAVKLDGSTGKVKFLYSGNEKGSIYADSSGNLQFKAGGSDGMYFNSDSQLYIKNDIFVTNGSIYGYNDIYSANGSVYGYNDVYSTHGSVWAKNDIYTSTGHIKAKTYMEAEGHITAGGDIYSSGGSIHGNYDIYTDGGSIRAYNDIVSNNGKVRCADKFQCSDKDGTTITYGFVRRVDHDSSGHVTSVKYGEVKTKGGIVYSIADA